MPCFVWLLWRTYNVYFLLFTLLLRLCFSLKFKGAGSRNRKQTCYLYNLYCCPHVAIVFCTDFGGRGESTRKLLPKNPPISLQSYNIRVFCLFLRSSRVHLESNIFILRKIVENLCDMAYQKFYKIVISKVCLHYVNPPL